MANINTTEVIGTSKFNRFHFMLLFWCTFIIAFDGYDLVLYGSVVPYLIEEWSITTVQAGAIGSYGYIGVMIGAISFGILADRIGRKNVIILCIVLFSLFTALCGFAPNPEVFSIYRFIAGLGLGGIMPNIIALMTDYSPKTSRSTLVSIVLCGYSVGGMMAPTLSIFLLPMFGWEIIFWIAGIPLLLLPIMYKQIPETPNFLIATGQSHKLSKILSKVSPSFTHNKNDQFEVKTNSESGSSVGQLFKNKRGLSTGMIWITFFMSLLMIYGLNTWLPNLMFEAGYALDSSLTFLIVLNFGAIVGTLIIGRLADKWGPKKMLIPMYVIGGICLVLLGFKNNIFVLYVLVAIAGACTIGSQNIVNAFVSQYYPPRIRSTALGVASGVGRIGAIIAPTLGGILLAASLPMQMNFLAFAIPGIIAAIALSFVPEKYAYYKQLDKNDSQEIKLDKVAGD
ncbi:aromatic acid/H+ symport family MFS transporter [Alkalihalobacillus sp. BA299]|uniref:MFS transporter n=1 Tax=Alkalihalobacillus sp. BA299 TaxID=2815938 RepID=UPI001ADB6BB8|nr:aromatic acid/H+ symport family MFS transporter [Alkalihalobacillus sp. BA299]